MKTRKRLSTKRRGKYLNFRTKKGGALNPVVKIVDLKSKNYQVVQHEKKKKIVNKITQ